MSKLESDMARLDKKLHSSGRKTKGNWGFSNPFGRSHRTAKAATGIREKLRSGKRMAITFGAVKAKNKVGHRRQHSIDFY